VSVVELVPAHFIDADGKDRLETRVNPFAEQPRQQQFINAKGRGMTEIKQQRMTQADCLLRKTLLIRQQLK